jgi:hypothetical protein|tara:strand:- start:1137 stop:1370 length:234 start_codon:yes stop_codon:yes gene_type:complete
MGITHIGWSMLTPPPTINFKQILPPITFTLREESKQTKQKQPNYNYRKSNNNSQRGVNNETNKRAKRKYPRNEGKEP